MEWPNMGDGRRQAWAIAALALVAAAVFCAVHGPAVAGRPADLDPDGYGSISLCLWRGQGFCADASSGPTVYRGPGYPAFVVLALALTGGSYPLAVWIGQCFLHAATAALAFLLAHDWWGRRAGWFAGVLAAVYPPQVWYVSRVWNETLLTVLTMALAWVCARLVRRPRFVWAVVAGLLLAGLGLTKATWLPFVVALPAGLVWLPPRAGWRPAAAMLLAALAAISPWTIRNVALTGQLVPVHTGAGFNMLLGNRLAFARRPLSYDALWREHAEAIVGQAPRRDGPAWLWEVESDVAFLRQALAEVASRPWLVPAKVITAGTMFWYIGQTDAKSAALALFRLPVLAAGVAGLAMALRRGEFHVWPAAALAAGYWVFHWPFAPPGRLATPVMPLLIVLAASLLRAPASPTAKE